MSQNLLALVLVGQVTGHAWAQGTVSGEGAFSQRLVASAIERTRARVIYDPAYRVIAYPGGDVAADRGVCSDVVVRSYRALGFDLQRLVHEDMRTAFRAYPRRWGLRRPDKNIDHRRVPNLRVFLTRHGKSLAVSNDAEAYQPGDLVTWDVSKPIAPGERAVELANKGSPRLTFARTPHIGIVTDRRSADGRRPLIVHNIGSGTQLQDMLFSFKITGRYRFHPVAGRN